MLDFKSIMLRKIFHVIAFLIIAALVISAVANNDPDDASKHLMLLSSTRDYKHAQARTEKIRQTLGL